ncbi:MAG: hypothetical protein RSB37_06175 [Acetivibrio sp.]
MLIACFIASISTIFLMVHWFTMACKELSHARQGVEHAITQVQLHSDFYPQVHNEANERAAINSLDTCRMIYHETVKNYNMIRKKPWNFFPAIIFGYHPLKDTDDVLIEFKRKQRI